MCVSVSVSVCTREAVRAGQRRDIFARVKHKAEQEIKSGKDGKNEAQGIKITHVDSESPSNQGVLPSFSRCEQAQISEVTVRHCGQMWIVL